MYDQYNPQGMEWKLICANDDGYSDIRWIWNCMTTSFKHPLRPIYTARTMVIKDSEITPTYTLDRLYRYWNQRSCKNTETISELSYQIPDCGCLNVLWPSESHSDITVRVGTEDFKLHKTVLAMNSHYFSKLFESGTPSDIRKITLNNINPIIFRKIVSLMYGYRIIINDLEGLKILSMATKDLQIKSIDERIRDTIARMIRLRL